MLETPEHTSNQILTFLLNEHDFFGGGGSGGKKELF